LVQYFMHPSDTALDPVLVEVAEVLPVLVEPPLPLLLLWQAKLAIAQTVKSSVARRVVLFTMRRTYRQVCGLKRSLSCGWLMLP
jgi:hypothetical protein